LRQIRQAAGPPAGRVQPESGGISHYSPGRRPTDPARNRRSGVKKTNHETHEIHKKSRMRKSESFCSCFFSCVSWFLSFHRERHANQFLVVPREDALVSVSRMTPADAAALAKLVQRRLQQLGPAAAADLLVSLPFDEQRILFRELPLDFAARLVPSFPYYHSYVLLHSRPLPARRC